MEIKKVTCLVCEWSTCDEQAIDNVNSYGECLMCQGLETLLRWDYADGSILVVNNETGDRAEIRMSK